jgi:hypothetical protein
VLRLNSRVQIRKALNVRVSFDLVLSVLGISPTPMLLISPLMQFGAYAHLISLRATKTIDKAWHCDEMSSAVSLVCHDLITSSYLYSVAL